MESRPSPPSPSIGLADLVGTLISLPIPSREVDEVVEAMLGGDEPRASLRPSDLRSGRWLSAETPAYTAGGGALAVLARRRGLKVRTWTAAGRGYAVATSSRGEARASALSEAGAGLAAIVRMAAEETSAHA